MASFFTVPFIRSIFPLVSGLWVVSSGKDLLDFEFLHQSLEVERDKLRAIIIDESGPGMGVLLFHPLYKVFHR